MEIPISDFEDILQTEWEAWKGLEKLYKIVDSSDDSDIGHGIITRTVVIKSIEDNRFFEFIYNHDEGRHPLDQPGLANPSVIKGVEVFPHEVTITVYKKRK